MRRVRVDGSTRRRTSDARIGPSILRPVVDAILCGTHERGNCHYELLRAFANNGRSRIDDRMETPATARTSFRRFVFIQRAARLFGERRRDIAQLRRFVR